MNYRNVRQIFLREIRDQLRDRRTLFIIAILPILLYPLLGMTMFQMAQFMQEQPTKVLVIGGEQMLAKANNDKVSDEVTRLFVLLKEPGKVDGQADVMPSPDRKIFSPDLFPGEDEAERTRRAKLLELTFWKDWKTAPKNVDPIEYAKTLVNSGEFDAAVYFAPDFAAQLSRFREAYRQHGEGRESMMKKSPSTETTAAGPGKVPQPSILYTTTNERSRITHSRLNSVLQYSWVEKVGRQNLIKAGLPSDVTKPFVIQSDDLAVKAGKSGIALWAKLLPLMLLLWALTGAFYPAIDLCAGEKERGTLETLLCSPAQRGEIVMGKLGTVMVFSIMTALLNLLSIGVTGWLMLSKIPVLGDKIGSPPWLAIAWLIPVLIPVAALFGAICISLAAFAKSSKEGQYYLMPVLLIVMPLAILPMTPNVELNLGTSLIPVTNICLILRVLIEGQYMVALKYAVPVIGVTFFCCLFAIQWAVDQFRHESVLFRESERLDLLLRLRNLFTDKQPTPTVAAAVLAGILILVVKFFVESMIEIPTGFGGFVRVVIVSQVAVILTPALLMTIFFTTSRLKTLLLGREAWTSRVPVAILMAVGLAMVGHPLAITFQHFVTKLYPIADMSGLKNLEKLFSSVPNFGVLLLLCAVLPAICEELAFRGFILSGFRHTGSKWRAITFTAILFGMTHGILQQSIVTATIGLVLGYLAVQSGNLLVPIAYHVTHNSLAMCLSQINEKAVQSSTVFGGPEAWDSPIMSGLIYMVNQFVHYFLHWGPSTGPYYDWRFVTVAALVFMMILAGFSSFRYEKTEEERLRKEIARNRQLYE